MFFFILRIILAVFVSPLGLVFQFLGRMIGFLLDLHLHLLKILVLVYNLGCDLSQVFS